MERPGSVQSMQPAPCALSVLLVLLLSGCTEGSDAPPGLPLDDRGRVLPTLYGIVVDAAIRPLAGAEVRILGGEAAVRTDEGGRYELHRPTGRAEDVLVTATMQGFLTRTQQSQASAHQSHRLDFVLEADPHVVPHVTILEHGGTMRCTAAVAAVGQGEGVACDADRRVDDRVAPWMWEINPTPNLAGAVVEVYWDAMSPLSQTLTAWLRAPTAGGEGGDVVAQATGTSPLRLEVPEDQARAMGRWTGIRLHVDLAEQDGGLPGAAPREQRYTAYASLFYVDAAPSGYTLG